MIRSILDIFNTGANFSNSFGLCVVESKDVEAIIRYIRLLTSILDSCILDICGIESKGVGREETSNKTLRFQSFLVCEGKGCHVDD